MHCISTLLFSFSIASVYTNFSELCFYMILSISLPLSLSLFLFMPSTRADVDIFRDSPLRYAGYLNEVGEAFRPLVPEFVVYLSYVAALSYVFADTASKGKAAAELQTGDFGCGQAAVFECLTFQMLASIIFPSFIINRWVALWGIITTDLFDTTTFISETLHIAPSATIVSLGEIAITPDSITGEIPTAAGLLLIPLIVSQSKSFVIIPHLH